jgi:hypothetical protein
MSPKWSSNIVLGGVYSSPSENTTSAVAEQFQHIESFMDPPRPDMNRKHDILLMVGNFNAKTGLVDVPLLSPPQISRKNFAYECTVGEQLNLSLVNKRWMIASGRRESKPAPTRCIRVL